MLWMNADAEYAKKGKIELWKGKMKAITMIFASGLKRLRRKKEWTEGNEKTSKENRNANEKPESK